MLKTKILFVVFIYLFISYISFEVLGIVAINKEKKECEIELVACEGFEDESAIEYMYLYANINGMGEFNVKTRYGNGESAILSSTKTEDEDKADKTYYDEIAISTYLDSGELEDFLNLTSETWVDGKVLHINDEETDYFLGESDFSSGEYTLVKTYMLWDEGVEDIKVGKILLTPTDSQLESNEDVIDVPGVTEDDLSSDFDKNIHINWNSELLSYDMDYDENYVYIYNNGNLYKADIYEVKKAAAYNEFEYTNMEEMEIGTPTYVSVDYDIHEWMVNIWNWWGLNMKMTKTLQLMHMW